MLYVSINGASLDLSSQFIGPLPAVLLQICGIQDQNIIGLGFSRVAVLLQVYLRNCTYQSGNIMVNNYIFTGLKYRARVWAALHALIYLHRPSAT